MSPSIEEEKRAYMLHSKLISYQRRVNSAIEITKQALSSSKNPLLSFSSGKDSVALLDIAVKAGFRGNLLFFKYGIYTDIETPKENVELLKYYAELYGLQYYILDCLGEVDCWEQCGRFILFPETKEEERIFRITNYDYATKAEDFCRRNGVDLEIIGMRKKESTRRRITLDKKGLIYQTRSRGSATCCPIGNLTDEDIWAYIFSNNLKYLSVYDYPYIDRRKNRNEITMLYNDALIRRGAIFHYRQMYPDFFSFIKKRWGEVGL